MMYRSLTKLSAFAASAFLFACGADSADGSEAIGASRARPALSPERAALLDENTAAELGILDAQDSAPALAERSQAVLNGDLITAAGSSHGFTAIWSFIQEVREWRQVCSGVMLTNTIVITAKHCFQAPVQVGAQTLAVSVGSTFFFTTGRVTNSSEGVDLAYLETTTPVKLNGSTTGYRRPALIGRWDFMWGGEFGEGQFIGAAAGHGLAETTPRTSTICKTGTTGCPGDPRPLRASLHELDWWTNTLDPLEAMIKITPNARGQMPYEGDSGGGVFLVTFGLDNLTAPLLGIVSIRFGGQRPMIIAESLYDARNDGMLCRHARCICMTANCVTPAFI